jgi:hypothetical protein
MGVSEEFLDSDCPSRFGGKGFFFVWSFRDADVSPKK